MVKQCLNGNCGINEAAKAAGVSFTTIKRKGIKSTMKYNNHGCTRRAKNPQHVAENILDRNFHADKANERLRRKYYRMIRHGKKKNVAVTAVARELACFIWGMMTDNIGMV